MQQNLLIKCPVCNAQISKNARRCPHCGEPLSFLERPVVWQKPETWLSPLLILFVVLPVSVLFLCFALVIIIERFRPNSY